MIYHMSVSKINHLLGQLKLSNKKELDAILINPKIYV